MGTSLFFATPRTKDAERRACPTNTHTHTLFSSSLHGRLSPRISFCDPHPTVFFCLFLSSFGYKPASRKSSFRPEQLRKPPYEPSRVDIQFYDNFKKLYTDVPLELSKDCLLYTSPSPRDGLLSRMPSSA